MVLSEWRLTDVDEVVERYDTPGDTRVGPVVPEVEPREGTASDSLEIWSDVATKRGASVDGVVHPNVRVVQHTIDRTRVAELLVDPGDVELGTGDTTLNCLKALILVPVTHLEVSNVCGGVSTGVSQGVSDGLEPGVELALQLGLESIQVDILQRSAHVGSTGTTHETDDVLGRDLSRVLDDLDLCQSECLSVTIVIHRWDSGGNRRSSLDDLDLRTADSLGSVSLDTHEVNTVERCVRTSQSNRLITRVLNPSVVQPRLAGADIDGHPIVCGSNAELVPNVRKYPRGNNAVEQRSELVSIVCPVAIHGVVETTSNGHMLIPFSRNDDLTGSIASEVDTEAVAVPLSTRRHGDGRNLREPVSRPGLSHLCELALDWNWVASGRDVVENIAYVEAIAILDVREVVDLTRDHLQRGILREHGVQNPERIPYRAQRGDVLLLKRGKRLPVLDGIWLVDLGVIPQDLSTSDRVL